MPVIANGTTSFSETSKRSYIATGVFTTYFYSYTSSRNANNQLVYTLSQNASATDAQCKAGHVLKENGRKVVFGVNNIDTNTTTTLTTSGNRPYYLVGVFDSSSMLSGFIDPNSPLFAPYSTDLPNFYDRSSSTVTGPDGTTNDMGPPVFTSGNITTSGVLYQVRNLVTLVSTTPVQLTTSGTTTNCIGTIVAQTPAANSTLNLPTAAALSTALGGIVGMSFEFVISNLSGTYTITLAVASGDSANTSILAASAVVAVNTNVRFMVRLTSATTVAVYRL